MLDAARAEQGPVLLESKAKRKRGPRVRSAWTTVLPQFNTQRGGPNVLTACHKHVNEARETLRCMIVNALSEYAGVPSLAETQASVGDKQTVPEFSDSPYPSGVGVNVALEMATRTDEVPGKLEAYLCLQWSVWKTSESEEFNILVMESRVGCRQLHPGTQALGKHRTASPPAATGSCRSVEPTVNMTGHWKSTNAGTESAGSTSATGIGSDLGVTEQNHSSIQPAM